MDFGEILKLWEAAGRPSVDEARLPKAGKAKARSSGVRPGEPKGVARLQSEWLDSHGVPEGPDPGAIESPEPRLTKREIDDMPMDATIDLHGMTGREAEAALSAFFRTAESTGCRKVLIVHGKGLHSASEPVLEGCVRRWLESRATAGRSGHADAANGGRGATWVLIRRAGNQRSR